MSEHLYKTTVTFSHGNNQLREREFYHMATSHREAQDSAKRKWEPDPQVYQIYTQHFLQLSSFVDNPFIEK